MSQDGKKTNSILNDANDMGLINRDEIPERYKDCVKSVFGIYELKRALEILEKFDVDEIEIILANDAPIIFMPLENKMGLVQSPREKL